MADDLLYRLFRAAERGGKRVFFHVFPQITVVKIGAETPDPPRRPYLPFFVCFLHCSRYAAVLQEKNSCAGSDRDVPA